MRIIISLGTSARENEIIELYEDNANSLEAFLGMYFLPHTFSDIIFNIEILSNG